MYSFNLNCLRHLLFDFVDILGGCRCYSTKMYEGGDTTQCQAFEMILNTLNWESIASSSACSVIAIRHPLDLVLEAEEPTNSTLLWYNAEAFRTHATSNALTEKEPLLSRNLFLNMVVVAGSSVEVLHSGFWLSLREVGPVLNFAMSSYRYLCWTPLVGY